DVAAGELVLVASAVTERRASLLRSLAGLGAAEGELRLGGDDLADRPTRARAARGLGFVPHRGGLAPTATVAEHVALGRGAGRRGPWTTAAVLEVMPELAPLRDRPVVELAALERRLTATARALAGNPSVLVVEEPTTDLDERAATVVADALT